MLKPKSSPTSGYGAVISAVFFKDPAPLYKSYISTVRGIRFENVLAVTKKFSDRAIGIVLPLFYNSEEWLFLPDDGKTIEKSKTPKRKYFNCLIPMIYVIKYKKNYT